ncbi:MAG: phospholipase D-like domain-containing protein [Treponema sp.]|nr:phospholipase D-like domain-containing protein [Treponema sp.]
MPLIYDNKERFLTDGLNEALTDAKRADFCVGYFNLRGWEKVAERIETLTGDAVIEGQNQHQRYCRLLVGMQETPQDILRQYYASDDDYHLDQGEAARLKKQVAAEFKSQLTIGAPSAVDEEALRNLSRQMKAGRIAVKLHLRYQLHAKLYLVYHGGSSHLKVEGYVGSSNLTFAGLVKQGELNVDVLEQDAAGKLTVWFDERWNDRWCFDITKELIEIIDASWARESLIPPYHIYLKIAYHLSREARAGINEFKLPKIFQKELLDFQQKAVLVAAHHLNKRNGVIIGDVVGLGKTITAIALAKLFEEDFFLETLIICPKNLEKMWQGYCDKYRLISRVLSQSMVQNELPNLRRYRLVIIDESHNLRNNEGARYRAIKAYLTSNESKVILLTATPYNKNYFDLSNQLRLFIPDDKDLGISPEQYIKLLGGQSYFNSKHTDTFIRSIKAFEKSVCPDDWRELMRLYLVRRTRSFIKNNYAETDKTNGRKYLLFNDRTKSYFPDRVPKKVEYEFNESDPGDIYARLYSEEVVDAINDMDLPRYGLQQYLDKKSALKPTQEESRVFENMSRAGRRLMGFCRTNLFKRLESSGYAFLLSLSRHILRNYIFIYALHKKLPVPIGKNITQNLDDFLEDDDTDNDGDDTFNFLLSEESYLKKGEEVYTLFSSGSHKSRFDWVRSEFFIDTLKNHLQKDSDSILNILKMGKHWNAESDRQLNALYKLLTKTHKNDKVLVFTQFSDTAEYLKEELNKQSILYLESVSGNDENPTEKAFRFSPKSNADSEIGKGVGEDFNEIRVLISTDVLSEGQNLQDCHIIVNYDLPWAIIRLIQRAGRVDRIGQQSSEIICYSFLPEDGVEKIISLRTRLRKRIEENASVVGSDETFFDGDPVNLADLYNEKAGIMDGDDSDDVDLASRAFQIWKNAVDNDPRLKEIIEDLPHNVFATKAVPAQGEEPEGVIVYVRTADDTDMLSWVDTKGAIITQSQLTILKAAFCTGKTPPLNRIGNHHNLVKKGVDMIRNEEEKSGGSLGKRSGVKYQVYMRLERYCKKYEKTLFISDSLKKGIDDIFKGVLTEGAKDAFSRQLKAGADDEQIANMVVHLREEDKLVVTNGQGETDRIPQIICSLGLRRGKE